LVVFVGLGGFDFGEDGFTCHSGDEGFIELRELGFAFSGVFKTSDGEGQECEVFEHVLVLVSVTVFRWDWVIGGEFVTSFQIVAFLILGVCGCGVDYLKVQEAIILGGWDESCFVDDDSVITVDK